MMIRSCFCNQVKSVVFATLMSPSTLEINAVVAVFAVAAGVSAAAAGVVVVDMVILLNLSAGQSS